MTQSTLIVSMTSYPARIKCAKLALESLTRQTLDKKKYHLVLTLAEPEFPKKEESLPEELTTLINENKIEIIWHPTNTRSHKKLMPTLKKYPKNPILVIDDDVIRDDDFLETFYNDHKKYPNDIIAGSYAYTIDSNLKQVRFVGGIKGTNTVPGMYFEIARPANGLGGTLYPAGTFTDERFFDEELMMKISPSSDESWQYCFKTMSGKGTRQLSKVYNNFEKFIDGSQAISTCLHKVNKYDEINKRIMAEFPEFKMALSKKEFIVSLTSHGKRIEKIDATLTSILTQSLKPVKICLCISEEDEKNITPFTKKCVEDGSIEIIHPEEDYRPHNKYFWTMKKYRTVPIITVDDDVEYDHKLFEKLYDSYRKHPNRISSARVHKIEYDKNGIPVKYELWKKSVQGIIAPSMDLLATGVGGVLYPPDILRISDDDVESIKKSLPADDIFLKYKENKLGIEIIPVNVNFGNIIKNDVYKTTALSNTNVLKNENDKFIADLGIRKTQPTYSTIEKKQALQSKPKQNPFIADKTKLKTYINKKKASPSWTYKPI